MLLQVKVVHYERSMTPFSRLHQPVAQLVGVPHCADYHYGISCANTGHQYMIASCLWFWNECGVRHVILLLAE